MEDTRIGEPLLIRPEDTFDREEHLEACCELALDLPIVRWSLDDKVSN